MPKNNNIKAHLALLAVSVFYSGNFIVAQDVMHGDFISPVALVFFRVFGAGILFWLFHFVFIKEKIVISDVPYFLLCSFVGIVLAQNIFLIGLEKTTTINASLLISTTPIMVTIFSLLILKQKLTKNIIVGLICAALGSFILISSKSKFEFGQNYVFGNLLIFLNAVTYGLYLVLLKPLLNKYHSLTVIKWVFTLAAPVILMISFQDLQKIQWSGFTSYAWIGLIYVVVFATFFTYSLNAYAINILTPVLAGFYLYLQPFLTTTLSIIFSKDHLNLIKIVAGIFILTGLYFAALRTNAKNQD